MLYASRMTVSGLVLSLVHDEAHTQYTPSPSRPGSLLTRILLWGTRASVRRRWLRLKVAWAVGEGAGSEAGAMVWPSTEAETSVELVQISRQCCCGNGVKGFSISGTSSQWPFSPRSCPNNNNNGGHSALSAAQTSSGFIISCPCEVENLIPIVAIRKLKLREAKSLA